MRKTLGKRLLSGITAALTAVMVVPNVAPITMAAGGNPTLDSGGAVFSLQREADLKYGSVYNTRYKYANELYAEIDFQSADGDPVSVDIPAQTYYLLVHAEGQSSGGGGYVYPTDTPDADKNYYKLYELGSGTSWSTGESFGDDLRPEYEGKRPATKLVEGFLLKNTGEGALSLDSAKELQNCEMVDSIEGFTVSPGTLSKTTGTHPNDPWSPAYGDDTVVMKAVPGYNVNINVYDINGNKGVVDTEGGSFYAVT